MVYRVIGIVNKAPFDGVELAFIEFTVNGQTWNYEVKTLAFYEYSTLWKTTLANATALTAFDYLQLHSSYGVLLGGFVKQFIQEQQLDYKIQLIGSPGCDVFSQANKKTIHALGDGAAIAAITGINVVSDYVQMDAVLGGSGSANSAYNKMIALTETGASRDSIGGAVWVGQDW
jgi:anhydro-N-acetylmuramic acid kinase